MRITLHTVIVSVVRKLLCCLISSNGRRNPRKVGPIGSDRISFQIKQDYNVNDKETL